jgi:hypothetical protein
LKLLYFAVYGSARWASLQQTQSLLLCSSIFITIHA